MSLSQNFSMFDVDKYQVGISNQDAYVAVVIITVIHDGENATENAKQMR